MPIERFSAPAMGETELNSHEYDFNLLRVSLERVLITKGINVIKVDRGESVITQIQFEVFSVGQTEQDAQPIVLVGWEMLEPIKLNARRINGPHKIIGPQDVIDAVKIQYEELKQSGFNPYRPSEQPRLA